MTNSVLENEDKLMMPLRYPMKIYSKHDGPTTPSFDAPIELVKYVFRERRDIMDKVRSTNLIDIVFYVILRVGEYMKAKRKIMIVQFRMKDVAFCKNKRKMDHKPPRSKHYLNVMVLLYESKTRKTGLKSGIFSRIKQNVQLCS